MRVSPGLLHDRRFRILLLPRRRPLQQPRAEGSEHRTEVEMSIDDNHPLRQLPRQAHRPALPPAGPAKSPRTSPPNQQLLLLLMILHNDLQPRVRAQGRCREREKRCAVQAVTLVVLEPHPEEAAAACRLAVEAR